jgi:predicted ATPase/DNA-binding CsgD family transcriptional regulator
MSTNLQQYEQRTPFVGRKTEFDAITRLLRDDQCRLLTLVGVGGVGKTRLAIRCAGELQSEFADGVYFVDLQAVHSTEDLVSAIANALGIKLSDQERPEQSLVHSLERKHLLLLLDNFEQLLPSSHLLSHILERVPYARFLVTSREALSLQEEHLYALEGLAIPESHFTKELPAWDSVQLFVERAQRIRQDFSPNEEQAGVVRICQLVEGMPLAIEMAASWVKTLRCALIAAEIQENLSFLRSNLRDVRERHQSMRAVFVQTWTRLSDEEKILFKKLSVFRSGFEWEGAAAVAGASVPLLSSLVDKCLVRRDQSGRYQIHELLRQFAEQELTPEEYVRIAWAHCAYIADFLAARERTISGREQLEASLEIEREAENLRAAWRYALNHHEVGALEKMMVTYFHYCQIRCHFLEGARASEQAVSVLERLSQWRLAAQSMVFWAWMLLRIGRLDKAEEVLARSLSLFKQMNIVPVYSHPLAAFSIVKGMRGDYAEAIAMGEQLKSESEARADLFNLSFACYGLTSAYLSVGEYDTAQQNAQQAVTFAERAGSRWFKAYCLIEWGKVAQAVGAYDEAESHYRTSLRIREEFNDPEGLAVLSVHLGEIALRRQNYGTASQLYEHSLTIYRDLDDRGGLATAYHGLGQVAAQTGKTGKAASYLREALTIANQIQFAPLVLTILLDIAELMGRSNRAQLAHNILQIVGEHPAGNTQHRQTIASLRSRLPVPAAATSIALDPLLDILQAELEGMASGRSSEQSLTDPLTSRELEILQMIVSGLSNTEIADKLVISPGTVKAHTSSIYSKLGVRNRAEAASRAAASCILP